MKNNMEIFKDMVGYHPEDFQIAEIPVKFKELSKRFQRFSWGLSVDISVKSLRQNFL